MPRPMLVALLLPLTLASCSPAESREATSSPSAAPAATAGNPAHDWPNWRGPTHDGISQETGWRSTWETEPATVWKKSIGTGFSSLSTRSGKLYTMGHNDGEDTVYCLNAATGEEIWTYSYPCDLIANLHEGGPAATPTIDGDRVYTVSKEGHFFCFDADTGQVHWQKKFTDQFDVKRPDWGYACSPYIWNDLVIVDAGCTAAFNKQTGEVVWQTEKFRPGYGSAISFKHDGEDLIAVLNNDVLLVVRARDGREIARTPWETSYITTSTTPIIAPDGTIFISTGYRRGCARFKLTGGKLEPIYENTNLSNHMNNSVLWGGHLYGFDGNSHAARLVNLTCLDYETGETQWQHRGLGCGSVMLADDKLILLSDKGKLVIAEATPEAYQPLAEAQILTGKCWTVPVLSGGYLYARNAAGDLVCVDLRMK